jgi:hypothetical protein
MNVRSRSSLLLALVALLLATAIAGCGGSSSSSSGNGIAEKSPAEILAATKVAADGAKSVHVAGSIVSGGTPITLDMQLVAGKGGRGQLSQNGLSFSLIEVGGTVYIKGSPAFYKHIGGSAAAQLLQGKWLKASATSSDFASLGQLTNLRELIDQTLSNHGALTKSATTTVKGQKVVGLSDRSKGGTLYVAASGKPYPLEITKAGSSADSITFDSWNEPLTLSAPANAIDINALSSAAK